MIRPGDRSRQAATGRRAQAAGRLAARV